MNLEVIVLLAAAMSCLPRAEALAHLPDPRFNAQSSQTSPRQAAMNDLKEMAAAGDSRSQVLLGLAYVSGDGVSHDNTQAVKWFRKSAEQGNPLGERYLAEMYFKGRGVEADTAEAARWLRMAAEQDDSQSQYNLAVLYTQGTGVPRNVKEAVKWMRRSAEQGLSAGEAGLGVFYENGDGVAADPVEAAKWYRKAIDLDNNTAALNNLARLLATTKVTSLRNPQDALAFAVRAVAAVKSAEYLDTLAVVYFEAGQFGKAVEAEQQALALDTANELYKASLQRYQSAAGQH